MTYDLDTYLSLLRASGLSVAPDGTAAVTTVAEVAPNGTKMRSSLWHIDPAGGEPRRLTRSSAGESSPTHLPDGSVLFVSARTDPDATDEGDDTAPASLWRLPAGGGEAQLVASPPAGVSGVAVAGDTGTVVVAVDLFPDVDGLDDDRARAAARKDAGVQAQLFDRLPIRYWDHYLGPRVRRYFVLERDPTTATGFAELRQLARTDGLVHEGSFDVTPDGTRLVFTRKHSADPLDVRHELVIVDVATGDEHTLVAIDAFLDDLTVSPDSTQLACVQSDMIRGEASDVTLLLIDLTTGDVRDIAEGLDLFPSSPTWSVDGDRLAFLSDRRGHRPIVVVDPTAGETTPEPITDAGSFSGVSAMPNGGWIALRSHIDTPPTPVLIGEGVTELAGPGGPVDVPGSVVDVVATADDGVTVRSWLVLPDGASAERPAPLVVWVHGGPVSSWNDWSWRWNPWLLAERGYAVLLPDPALSTGYGLDFIQRGYGRWGERPYTDVLAAVDAAEARPDVDGERTALMGGSFGGYMANWVAGHTDRFSCIVTHASLWALDQFHGTTDAGPLWEREFGDPYVDASTYEANSPHRHIGSITTPMLVIHGELDHRVPISEALRLWTDLQRHGVESKFLYFPDENHWILKPQNARVWYETVFAWLDLHVRGADWRQPTLL